MKKLLVLGTVVMMSFIIMTGCSIRTHADGDTTSEVGLNQNGFTVKTLSDHENTASTTMVEESNDVSISIDGKDGYIEQNSMGDTDETNGGNSNNTKGVEVSVEIPDIDADIKDGDDSTKIKKVGNELVVDHQDKNDTSKVKISDNSINIENEDKSDKVKFSKDSNGIKITNESEGVEFSWGINGIRIRTK